MGDILQKVLYFHFSACVAYFLFCVTPVKSSRFDFEFISFTFYGKKSPVRAEHTERTVLFLFFLQMTAFLKQRKKTPLTARAAHTYTANR